MKTNHKCLECGKKENGDWMDHAAKQLQDRELCHTCNFWYELFLVRDNNNSVRIDGHHYYIEPETSTGFRGHSGRLFKIKFHDGRYKESTNLWYQGEIDKLWKEKLPDNAEFDKI